MLTGVLLAVLTFPLSLWGQEVARSGWQARVAPYVWLSSVDGGYRFRDVNESEVPVGDSALHLGLAARVKAWRGGLIGFAELTRTTVPSGQDLTIGTAAADAVDLRISTIEAGGGFRVGRPPPGSVVELLGGGRYVRHVRTAIPEAELPAERRRRTVTWMDPFAGARFRSGLGGGFRFGVSGSIAGGGIGSDFTWEMDAELGFRPVRNAELLFRYRFRETEYDAGGRGYVWNGRTQGWLFGVGVLL